MSCLSITYPLLFFLLFLCLVLVWLLCGLGSVGDGVLSVGIDAMIGRLFLHCVLHWVGSFCLGRQGPWWCTGVTGVSPTVG